MACKACHKPKAVKRLEQGLHYRGPWGVYSLTYVGEKKYVLANIDTGSTWSGIQTLERLQKDCSLFKEIVKEK